MNTKFDFKDSVRFNKPKDPEDGTVYIVMGVMIQDVHNGKLKSEKYKDNETGQQRTRQTPILEEDIGYLVRKPGEPNKRISCTWIRESDLEKVG